MACPRDTNGDGDCGSRYCPFCGQGRQTRVAAVRSALVGIPHGEQYRTSATFKAQIDILADMMVTLTDSLAEQSVEVDRRQAEMIRQVMREPARLVIDPGRDG